MCDRERARLGGHVGPRRVCRRFSFATRIIDTGLILITVNALFLSDDEEVAEDPRFRRFVGA